MYLALSVVTGFQCDHGYGEAGDRGWGEGVDQKSEMLCKKYWNSFYENNLIVDTKSSWFRKKNENLVYFL